MNVGQIKWCVLPETALVTPSTVVTAGRKFNHRGNLLEFFAEISTAWSEGWGAAIATILAVIALLKSMGKEIQQLGSAV